MKYLKSYESIFKEIELGDNYFWSIKGNNRQIQKICNIFLIEMRNKYNTEDQRFNFTENEWMKEVYIYYEKLSVDNNLSNDFNSYFPIANDRDKKDADDYNIKHNKIYQGELRIVNNKLILDTLDKERKKYNL